MKISEEGKCLIKKFDADRDWETACPSSINVWHISLPS